MRKVLLTFFLVLSLSFSITFIFGVTKSFAKEDTEVLSEDPKYRYIKIIIHNEVWILVLDETNRIIDLFPDGCGEPHPGGG
jgi:hypothetical protein